MADFKSKMHQIRSTPDLAEGAYRAQTAVFSGSIFKGREERKGKEKREGGTEGMGREGKRRLTGRKKKRK